MYKDGKFVIGNSENEEVCFLPKMANRHGLIAGATGTGKTVTLRVLAESFSQAGVPVFLADAKGDVSGFFLEGEGGYKDLFPTSIWDLYQENGIPLRTTISEMGPMLLSRVLELNDTQTDIMTIIFKIADDENLLLIDTKDLKSMLSYVGENASEYSLKYGNIAKQSLSAIVRSVVALEAEGGELFFGEPALNITDWIGCDENGKGKIQVLDCRRLMQNPTMYASFMLWMMSELFETLPEVGDAEKPKMVFFFDEAHMLFDDAPKALLQKVEQVVKLIRSKGVGIYFITQNPTDIPDGVLSQLGNKILHALHAYTPADQKKVKAAAESFRENPEFDSYDTLLNLGIGEALVSVLDETGAPTVTQKTKIFYPPLTKLGAITEEERRSHINGDLLFAKYSTSVDNDSAYEFLERKKLTDAEEAERQKEEAEAQKLAEKQAAAEQKEMEREEKKAATAKKRATKNVASTVASTVGREMGQTIGKSVGGSFGKKLGGNVGASLARGILGNLFKN